MTAPRTPPATDSPRKPSPVSRLEAYGAAIDEQERAEISAHHAKSRGDECAELDAERSVEWLAVAGEYTRRAEVFGKIAALIERCGDGVIAARLNVLAQQEAEAAAALDALDDGEAETADLSSRSLKGVG